MMITFTTFHVENEQTDAKAEVQSNVVSKNIYHVLIGLLFRSAAIFHPGCKTTVLSNQRTQFHYLSPKTEIFRTEISDRAPLMFSRLATQIEFIEQVASTSNVVFLDSDILINANVTSLFDQEFDIALTYREQEDMPINWGVMFVSQRNPMAAVRFLKQVLEQYRTQYFTNPIFWCDQYALMDTIGRDRFFNRTCDRLEIDGVKILLVPCATYNFSPENRYRSLLAVSSEQKILHFKGYRKRFMELYWQTFLQPRETPGLTGFLKLKLNQIKLMTTAFKEVLASKKALIIGMLDRGKNWIGLRSN